MRRNENSSYEPGFAPAARHRARDGLGVLVITLTIPFATPSLNTMLRQHWSVDRKLKARWKRLVWAARLEANDNCLPVPRDAFQRARITITRFSPRMLDADNATGGAKHIVDGLRACGIIIDDTPEHIELTVRQEKGDAATRIDIEALA